MALKTFFAVVTQYDCDPKENPPGSEYGAHGPLLVERYLDNDSACSAVQTRQIADGWERTGHHGWCRVATVTVDIPRGANSLKTNKSPPAQQQQQPTQSQQLAVASRPSLVVSMATKYGIEPEKMLATLKQTAFRQRGKNGGTPPEITNEQMMALMLVANEYNLNPWTKEIYAFPQDGGIVAVVGVDGWLSMINRHPQLEWMELEIAPHEKGEMPEWFECRIKRKDRTKPTAVREYYEECKRNTDPWRDMPRRMLRHKAIKECGRVAFSFVGVVDPEEADVILNAIDITPPKTQKAPVEAPKQKLGALPAPANDEQLTQIRAALDKTGIPESAVLAQFEAGEFKELNFDEAQHALEWISANAP